MDRYLEGLGDLRQSIKDMRTEVRTKHARRVAAAGGGELKKEAKRLVVAQGLVKSRALLNNIVIKREPRTPDGIEQYNLGVRHGRALGNGKKVKKFLAIGRGGRIVTRRQDDPFYWRFLEFGHKIVPRASGKQGIVTTTYTRTTRKGKVRVIKKAVGADAISVRRRSPTGFVKATPFIKPALENKAREVLTAMEAMAKKLLVDRQQ
jgi:HK97 gp10 family phage protein